MHFGNETMDVREKKKRRTEYIRKLNMTGSGSAQARLRLGSGSGSGSIIRLGCPWIVLHWVRVTIVDTGKKSLPIVNLQLGSTSTRSSPSLLSQKATWILGEIIETIFNLLVTYIELNCIRTDRCILRV